MLGCGWSPAMGTWIATHPGQSSYITHVRTYVATLLCGETIQA